MADRTALDFGGLAVRELVIAPGASPITQAIAPGEIVGLAGLDGHGQELFLKMLAGLEPSHGGSIELGSSDASRKITGFRKAVASGIAYLPRDRRANGIFPTQSVLDNFAVSTLSRDTRLGLISPSARKARYDLYREKLSIVAPRPDAPITTLSGGNQQKVLL
ncbi:ATP-binding cassette domain-containing protein, partial [Mesorhizobium sp. M7A.F.Ca.ET.027.03.2.1]